MSMGINFKKNFILQILIKCEYTVLILASDLWKFGQKIEKSDDFGISIRNHVKNFGNLFNKKNNLI